jgi:hypothetical protein
MKQFFLSALVIGSVAFLASCKKETEKVDRPTTTLNYKLTADKDIAGFGMNENRDASTEEWESFEWTGGSVGVSEIKFEAVITEEDKVEIKSTVDQRFDLFDAWASIGSVEVPQATFQKIEFKINFAPVADQPSLLLTGSFEKDGQTVPMSLIIDHAFELSFEKSTPTVIGENTDEMQAQALMAVAELSQGFTEEMFFNAERTNNEVIISKDSNKELYDMIWQRIESILKIEIK